MQTCLGLDIGTYSIKAVVLKISYDVCDIKELVEKEILISPENNDKIAIKTALNEILESLVEKEFDSVLANFGCNHVVAKKFELNNVKRRDRQKILESEFDLLGVFNTEDYSIEYHTLDYGGITTKLLAFFIKKAPALNLVSILAECDLSVRIIDIDNVVFLNLVNCLSLPETISQREFELFIDFGHSKTSLTIIEKNRIINMRVISLGGFQLTQIIQKKLSLNYDEAQNFKHNLFDETEDKNFNLVKKICDSFYEELCLEINRTIKSFHALEKIKISHIFITGGGSKYEEFDSVFQRNIDIPFSILVIGNENLEYSLTQNYVDFKTFSQCIAVGLRGNFDTENSKINIRHGSLSLVSDYDKITDELTKYIKIVALFVIILFSTYFFRYYLYEKRIDEMKTSYQKEIVSLYSSEPRELTNISKVPNWDFSEYSEHALKLIKENKKSKISFIETMSSNNVSTPLKILDHISQSVPKNIYFEVVNFKYAEESVVFEADTTSSESINQIIANLKKIEMLDQVTKKSEMNKAGTDGKIVHFVVSANLKAKGE